jgi:hypothetical protein
MPFPVLVAIVVSVLGLVALWVSPVVGLALYWPLKRAGRL